MAHPIPNTITTSPVSRNFFGSFGKRLARVELALLSTIKRVPGRFSNIGVVPAPKQGLEPKLHQPALAIKTKKQ